MSKTTLGCVYIDFNVAFHGQKWKKIDRVGVLCTRYCQQVSTLNLAAHTTELYPTTFEKATLLLSSKIRVSRKKPEHRFCIVDTNKKGSAMHVF